MTFMWREYILAMCLALPLKQVISILKLILKTHLYIFIQKFSSELSFSSFQSSWGAEFSVQTYPHTMCFMLSQPMEATFNFSNLGLRDNEW